MPASLTLALDALPMSGGATAFSAAGGCPLIPLTPSVGLSIGVVTIAGAMGVGVTTDPELVPGGDALALEIEEAFAALRHVAGARSRPRG